MSGRRTVAAGVWITRGSAHDPDDIAGATHLVEHLTLRSCGGRDRRSLALAIDRLGGEVDAWTSSELMGVSVNTTVDALDEALDLLVDAILTPTFAPDDVALELRVTEAELELMADDPGERVEEALLRAAWGDHPLARPVIGTRESLARLTPAVLERHHEMLVRPGRDDRRGGGRCRSLSHCVQAVAAAARRTAAAALPSSPEVEGRSPRRQP